MNSVRQLKIGFIYNHEVPHQVAHTAPILKEMLKRHPHLDIDVLTSTEEQKNLVKSCLGTAICNKTNFIDLDVTNIDKGLIKAANSVAPARRVMVLRNNLELLSTYDVFIVPESTSMLLKSQFGLNHLKFVLTHHGAGDRAVGEKDTIRDFDFVLISGEKREKRHRERGLIREGSYAVVGYPKFDFVSNDPVALNLFDNDNLTVIYNPHFDPHLSSWYNMGREVLEAFAKTPDINLIFAPHIMMFERRLHTSLEHKKVRLRKNFPEKFFNLPNIHIDLGSTRSVDMTYTRLADIYLGDVSSQIYEFLETRRPTIFLNSHNADWAGNPIYKYWSTGPVLDNVDTLIKTVRDSNGLHKEFIDAQNQAFNDTFGGGEGKPSVNAADAIADFLMQEAHSEGILEAAQ